MKFLGFSILVAVILVLCAPGALAAYPESYGKTISEWITNVNFSGIDQTTGGESKGYGNYTDISASVSINTSYNLSVTIHKYGHDYVTAWIDWNQDEDFNDTGEEFVVVADTETAGPHTVPITVPEGATIGTTRMRVSLKWGSAPPSYGYVSFGEVEDYSVQVSGPAPPIPELPTAALFSIGLLLLVGYVLRKK